ncbi:hypothetical protein HanHA300_Chr13g0501741 [Helianthus annuus]|nr:hypothetical protein HanHA300_Chr13g0501741 [Helianthus annuus]KAJ0499478.1 hypothetical protein HanHA89_Chr13g0534501 [Helianthus annuus]
MGVRPLREDEESWYEHIRGNFMYPVADAFSAPPTTTEGAQFPKPRTLRSVTSAGKEVLYLSSEESVGSSNGELSPWANIFAGVLRDLGIDPEEKKKKPPKKKKTIDLDPEVTSKGAGSGRATVAAAKGTLRLRQSDLNDYVIISGSLEGLSRTTDAGVVSAPTVGLIPLVGKSSNLRSLYKFSPEIKKKTPEKGVKFSEPEPKRPKITIKSSHTAEQDAAKAAEAQRKADERQKREEERKRKTEEDRERKDEEERKRKADEKREKRRQRRKREPKR